jgi:DNA-3-methyladenine glycosylase
MSGPAGLFYVYRVYGLHWMLNVVTGGVDELSAVLIRRAGDLKGPGRLAETLASMAR